MSHPIQITPLVTSVTAPNPSGMTLEGTNTYLIAADESETAVVVDPGPETGAAAHWERVEEALAGRSVELILVTHRHLDHTGAVDLFAQRTEAPVRGADPAWCRDAEPLTPQLLLEAAGTVITAVHTPGHTSDSYCFLLPDNSLLTGDTLLGEGTTMLDHPDGTLTDYLDSLTMLSELGRASPTWVLPAHGPVRYDVAELADTYAERRRLRVDQAAELLEANRLSINDVEVDETGVIDVHADLLQTMTTQMYPEVPDIVLGPARRTLAAHVQFLRDSTLSSDSERA